MRVDSAAAAQWTTSCAGGGTRRAGRPLHEDGRRPYDQAVAEELLGEVGRARRDVGTRPSSDETTHDDVRADHDEAVTAIGGFGVRSSYSHGRAGFGPVVVPAPAGDERSALWDLTEGVYSRIRGLYEIKTTEDVPTTCAPSRRCS
jgi:hypothetical protein